MPTSILDRGLPIPPLLAPLKATVALRIANQVRGFKSRTSTTSVPVLVQSYQDIYNAVWSPVDRYTDGSGVTHIMTPQQVCDGLGTDTVSLFTFISAYSPAILVLSPGSISSGVPVGKVVTQNTDGTVTITP